MRLPPLVARGRGETDEAAAVIEISCAASKLALRHKKELKELQKSGADIVYDERKGKLYLNGNGEAKGWGSKAIGGLIAKVKGKPQVSANDVTGFDRFVDQEGLAEFRQLREEMDLPEDMSMAKAISQACVELELELDPDDPALGEDIIEALLPPGCNII